MTDSTDSRLMAETNKWKTRIENEIGLVTHVNERGKEFLETVNSYKEDSEYFTRKNDLVRAFEAIIWAWAFYEIGKKIGVIIDKPSQ